MLQPIYIYTVEKNNKKAYILYYTQPKDHAFCRFDCINCTLYISPDLSSNYDLEVRHSGAGFIVSTRFLSSIRLITFNELLDIITEVNKSKNVFWKVSKIINMLQLILAKWDDWY
jgi:hypothetical protein